MAQTTLPVGTGEWLTDGKQRGSPSNGSLVDERYPIDMSISNLPPRAVSYHWSQVALHWLVALLVAVQYATGGSIGRTHAAVAYGIEPDPFDLTLHAIHNRAGLTILVVMLARLALRLLIGVPEPLNSPTGWRRRLVQATHAAFYLILIAQASTGAVAAYVYWPVSTIHGALSNALLALIALHASAAFWHLFIRRDGTMRRIFGFHA